MEHFDSALTQWINHFAGTLPVLDDVAIALSAIGVPVMILTVVGLWWRRTERYMTRHVAIVSGLAFCLGLTFNQLILLFIHRPRPYEVGLTHLLIAPTADFSFPSDHATASAAIAFAFYIGGFRKFGLGFAAVAFFIALSRIYVGTHYVSDVAGGALTALVAALLAGGFYPVGNRLDHWLTRFL